MKIAVGSKNPIKIEATRIAFSKVFEKANIEVIGVIVSSGISDMPLSFLEMVKGAKNRARQAIGVTKADFGVGMEGGFEKEELATFLSGFVAVIDSKGRWGYGKGTGLYVPDWIVNKVENENKELGSVMDGILNIDGVKTKQGTTGFMTKNLVPRAQGFAHTLIYALSRFMREEIYKEQ